MTGAGDRQYAAAGVDLSAADAAKERIGLLIESARTPLSTGRIGGFGGMVRLPEGMRSPVLVMSTDGVGTKVLVATAAKRLHTVGEDLVNHSVNDILVHGARPIAFLDYVAGASLGVEEIGAIVEGVAQGCRAHDMALAGGETAQMPGLYQAGHFDLAGTIIGVVEAERALHGNLIVPGDRLLGLASTGLHTNGYTLARRIVFETAGLGLEDEVPGTGASATDALLAVHRSYAAVLRPLLDGLMLHGLAHITGGGIAGNLVRVLPVGTQAIIQSDAWPLPPLFRFLQTAGGVTTAEMRDVFNLGVGMIAVLPRDTVSLAQATARAAGVESWEIGEVVEGERGVSFKG